MSSLIATQVLKKSGKTCLIKDVYAKIRIEMVERAKKPKTQKTSTTHWNKRQLLKEQPIKHIALKSRQHYLQRQVANDVSWTSPGQLHHY